MPPRDPRELSPTGVFAAPMAGGPSTLELVEAVGEAGAVGFVAGGYQSARALREQVATLRSTSHAPFGVNVFVPGAPARDARRLAEYLDELRPDATALSVSLGEASWDDDDWSEKVAALLDSPPPLVSFTFGCPPIEVVDALQAAGAQVWITVTSIDEARAATGVGADALCVQGPEAGAHRGRFDDLDDRDVEMPLFELIDVVARTSELPIVAAGGIMSSEDLDAARARGAVAAQCGTAFLRCPESGTSETHRAALASGQFTGTSVTRAFSGRRARGLTNAFMRAHRRAPSAYPEINNATRPLRAAAGAAHDADRMSLWAGTGFRRATAEHAGEVVARLAGR